MNTFMMCEFKQTANTTSCLVRLPRIRTPPQLSHVKRPVHDADVDISVYTNSLPDLIATMQTSASDTGDVVD